MRGKIAVLIGTFILVLITGILYLWNYKKSGESKFYEERSEEREDKGEEETVTRSDFSKTVQTDQTGNILVGDLYYGVFVCGEVHKEGVYYLNAGSRVSEAIEAAGGFTAEADTAYWNLAAYIYDGQRIFVPQKGQTMPVFSEIIENSGLVNLNTASVEELMTLPGIGQKRAEDILQYRSKIGRFQNKEQIMEISGIKESLYRELENLIVVQ